MYYYSYAALIFFNGKIKKGVNSLFESENPVTYIELKKEVEHNHSGLSESYSDIIITCWEKIDKETHDHIQEGKAHDKFNTWSSFDETSE